MGNTELRNGAQRSGRECGGMALGNIFNCSVKMQLSGTFLNIFGSDVSAQIDCYKINVGRPYMKFALNTFNLFSLIFCEKIL